MEPLLPHPLPPLDPEEYRQIFIALVIAYISRGDGDEIAINKAREFLPRVLNESKNI